MREPPQLAGPVELGMASLGNITLRHLRTLWFSRSSSLDFRGNILRYSIEKIRIGAVEENIPLSN